MAVLQKIRDKAGLAVSIIIALALLSFIIDPSTVETALNSMSSKNDVGQIAGRNISYMEFQEEVDKFSQVNQIMTGSSVQNEKAQEQVRNATWQSLLDRYMFIKNAKAAGINVGEEEMLDLTVGNNPSPVLTQSGLFSDASGAFSKEALSEFIKNISANEEYNLLWKFLTSNIQIQQYYSKYGSLFVNSAVENELMAMRDASENNTTYNVDFVLAPYSAAYDSSIVIAKSDIKKFYEGHKKDFKQNASRDIEYVMFEVIPSEKDQAAAREKFTQAYQEFQATDNVKGFITRNSEASYTEYWYRQGELAVISPELDDFAFSGATGVSDPVQEGNTIRAARVFGSAMVSDSVYVRHILLQGSDAQAKADSLLGAINKGADFASIAAVYSVDQNSAVDGKLGNLGWMTQTYIFPGFESVITAATRKPFILTTRYGVHIVEVLDKTKPVLKKQVAVLEQTAIASKETYNSYYAKASNFVDLAGGNIEGFHKAADSLKVYIQPANRITEGTDSYGSIEQAKEVTRWAFDAKKGQVSGIIKVNNDFYFVATLKNIYKEGYAPLEDVSSVIERVLYAKAASKKAAEEVAEKIKGMTSLEQVSTALGQPVSNTPNVTFSTMGAVNTDPALAGAVASAVEGKVSGPVAGEMGTYVFVVNSKDVAAYFTEDDAKRIAAQKAQYSSQMISTVMAEEAEVKDNRARFF